MAPGNHKRKLSVLRSRDKKCVFSWVKMAASKRDREVLDLLTMIADDSEFSSDSEEEELEFLSFNLLFSPKRVKEAKFNVDDCSEADFETLFRGCLRQPLYCFHFNFRYVTLVRYIYIYIYIYIYNMCSYV